MPIHNIKLILGLTLLVLALLLCPFAWDCFVFAGWWFKFIPVIIIGAIILAGRFLVVKRRQVISKQAKILLILLAVALIVSPALLDAKIRYDRTVLQTRAKTFLLHPVPKEVMPNAEGYIGDEYVGTNEDAEHQVLGDSLPLIKRYAANGRIRWSAVIQGQFASTSDQLIGFEELEKTNQYLRAWDEERTAILGKEWRMGYWQWVEDTMEMKQKIPEIEEEDAPAMTNNSSH